MTPFLKTEPLARSAPPSVRTRLTPSRRVRRAGAGAALIAGSAFAAAALFTNYDHQRSVLVATRTVLPGQRLTTADLGVATVSGSGLSTMPASQLSTLVGRVVTARLVPGAALAPGDLVVEPQPSSDVELPMTLKAGGFPPGLEAGDQVLVVPTQSSFDSSGTGSGTPIPGTVTAVTSSSGFGETSSTVVVVLIPRQKLVLLADAAANEQVVLARTGAP